MINTWRPDRGRGVYHTLRDVLDGKEWEYGLVVEKHQSCHGHVHVAVFVDGAVSESDFHPVIDHHLRECEFPGRDACEYYAQNPETRPISVRGVDPDLDPEDHDANRDDLEHIGNLGSYIGEYIGAYGEELFDRSIEELAFRAVCWATGTQIVRFSTGANEMIDRELGGEVDQAPSIQVTEDRSIGLDCPDPEDGAPFEVSNPSWEVAGICRVAQGGEEMFDTGRSGVMYREIDGAENLDPPKQLPFKSPRRVTSRTHLNKYR